MNAPILTVSLLFVALFAYSCGKNDSAKKPELATTNVTDDNSSKTTAEMTREQFLASADSQLASLQASIDNLEAIKNQELDINVKNNMEKRLVQLRKALMDCKQKIIDIKATSESSWKDDKVKLGESLNNAENKINLEIERQNYQRQIAEKLNKIDSKMVELKKDSSRLVGELKQKSEEEYSKLELEAKKLKQKYEELKVSADEKWEVFKNDFEDSFDKLSNTFKDIF